MVLQATQTNLRDSHYVLVAGMSLFVDLQGVDFMEIAYALFEFELRDFLRVT